MPVPSETVDQILSLSNGFSEWLLLIQFGASLSYLVAFAFHKLPIHELISRCRERSRHWHKDWRAFQDRFDKLILFYIYNEFKKMFGETLSNRFHQVIKDLRQDVYINLLKNDALALKRFRGKDERSLKAYLHKISRNVVLNHVNSKYVRNEQSWPTIDAHSDLNKFEKAEPESASVGTLEEISEREFMESIIETLRHSYRSRNIDRDILVFKLFYFEGFTARQIVEIKNVRLSRSGVETLVNRMKKSLQQLYSV